MPRMKDGPTYLDESDPRMVAERVPAPEAGGRRMVRATARILHDDILYVPGVTIDMVPVDAETHAALAAAGFIDPTPWEDLQAEPTALVPTALDPADGV